MNKKSEPLSRIPKLEKKYQDETRLWLSLLCSVFIVLLFFSFAQFALLDNFFKTTFNIPDRAKVFGIPSNNLLGFIATATLPITVLIDESNILTEKVKLILPFIGRKFSTIWIVFLADLLLTSLAFWESNQSREFSLLLNSATSFTIGASFSTFILYLTKGMTAVGKKANLAWRNLQIVSVYGIDPLPYGDDEKVRLSTEAELAKEEATNLSKKLEDTQIKYELEIQALLDKLNAYEKHFGALVKLKDSLKQIKEMFQELTPKSQVFFDKFAALEESLSNFVIPKIDSKEFADREITSNIYKVTSKEQNSTEAYEVESSDNNMAIVPNNNNQIGANLANQNLWQNLNLPSEISPLVINILKMMEKQNFPVPKVGKYKPKNNLANCTFLQFDPYNIIVYCRDENYMRGDKWDSSDELKFKCKSIQQTMKGAVTLHFTEQELLSDTSGVIEQIKSALAMRKSLDFEE